MDETASYSDMGDSFSGGTNASIYSFQPTWTLNRGKHSIRSGSDLRVYREESFPSVHSAGRYDFARGAVLTRQLDNSPASAIGQDLAAVLLGIPSGGTIDRSADRFNQVFYGGVFVQDDWRISTKLTMNLGLRWEYEGAPTERENRNSRGFDPDADLTIAGAAQAAYAANPIPEIAPSAFRVRGGLLFASDSNRGTYNPDLNNFQPRVGFAYQIDPKTVFRGGWAIYAVPALFDVSGIYQPGFSQGTSIVPSLDTGVTVRANLANPFPDGVADPPGSSNGPNTFVGRTIGRFNDDLDYRNGQSMRWSLSMQRELPGQWVVEGAYVASRSYDLTTDINANAVPRQYLSTSNVRDTANINFLTANVSNPFAGLLPGETLNGGTTQRQQLLRPFPQFVNIDTRRYDGSSSFDSAQFRLERRFRGGYTVLGAYTWSDFKESVTRLNDTDSDYEERLNDTQLPHRLVLNGIWELPFGKEARWGKDVNPVVNGLIGNWSVSFIMELAVGPAEHDDGERLLRRRHHPARRPGTAAIRHNRYSTRAGSTSTMRRFRPTAWTTRPSSAPTRGSSSPPAPRSRPTSGRCPRGGMDSGARATPTGTCRSSRGCSSGPCAPRCTSSSITPSTTCSSTTQPQPDQRRFRQGHDPEQPAAQHPDRDQVPVLSGTPDTASAPRNGALASFPSPHAD